MNNYEKSDNLSVALWKISGLQRIVSGLQSSDLYEECDQNLFFVISEELNQISTLLKTVE